MDDEKPSLLYKVKPISDRLPAVKRPEGHVHFRTKMMWVAVILVLYFVMSNVYVWGLDQSESLDIFAQYRTIMAGASGTILQLGIGPIVTASIIMQLFVGAKIIKLDLSNKKDKACYQSVLKLLVIVMIFVEAIPQVFGYLVPSDTFTDTFGSVGAKLLIILQLFVGSYLVFLFDEVISEMGYRQRYLAVHCSRCIAGRVHRCFELVCGRQQFGHVPVQSSCWNNSKGDIRSHEHQFRRHGERWV